MPQDRNLAFLATLAAGAVALAPASGHASWAVTEIDRGGYVGAPAAVFDSRGVLSIAFGDGAIRYAREDGQGFRFETIDGSSACLGPPRLALAPDGTLAVAYQETGADQLRYARRGEGGWTWEVVAGTDRPPALAFNRAGRPHLAFVADSRLHLASRTGTTWAIETLPSGGWQSRDLSLSFDADDQPAIAYHDDSQRDLRVARFDGAAWSDVLVDGVGTSSGRMATLVHDPAGRPEIAYEGGGDLKLARLVDDAWQADVVDPGPNGLGQIGFTFDRSGAELFAYGGTSDGDVRLARRAASGWEYDLVDDDGRSPALALDATGSPRVVFARYRTQELLSARKDGADWTLEVVARPTVPQGDLAAEGDAIAVAVARDRLLRVRSFDGVRWAESEVGPGENPSLALGPGADPAVAYVNPASGELRYAAWDGAWQGSVIAPGSWLGYVLARDGAGEPTVLFQAGVLAPLQIARHNGDGTWWTEPIDAAPTGTQSMATLALNPAGKPAVAYYQQGTLWYAERMAPGVWDIRTVEAGGWMPSLAFDRGASPVIAFTSGGSLRVATRVAGTWTSEVVDGVGTGGRSSLALDGSDRPVVLYYDQGNQSLKLAYPDAAGEWIREVIDLRPAGLSRTSLWSTGGTLALGRGDVPAILFDYSPCGAGLNGLDTLWLARRCRDGDAVQTGPLHLVRENAGRDVALTWEAFGASSHAVWLVRDKVDIPAASGGGGPAEPLPSSPTLLPRAKHADGVGGPGGSIAFYGVEPRCGSGACCGGGDGLCREVTDATRCQGSGDSYRGDGSSCASGRCGAAVGACCDPSDPGSPLCLRDRTFPECQAAGLTWGGVGTTCCDPNPCFVFETGACCAQTSGCLAEDMWFVACAACLGGMPAAPGTTCLDCP